MEIDLSNIFRNKQLLAILGVVVILVAIGPSAYFYNQYQKTKEKLSNPNLAAQEETTQLIEKVGKLIDLPVGETPTVATITDREKLSNQPFFARAKNGDKVLVYTNARKAILYDPVANRVIDVAPINIGTGSAEAAQPLAGEFKLVIRNGTKVPGAGLSYESEINSQNLGLIVTALENAKRQDYDKTVLVDVAGDKGAKTAELASRLGISVGNLPAGESKPEADFVVILGSDKAASGTPTPGSSPTP